MGNVFSLFNFILFPVPGKSFVVMLPPLSAMVTISQELAGKLGVRGLPMLIFYKNGKRVDHHTTANINTIEEAIRDNC